VLDNLDSVMTEMSRFIIALRRSSPDVSELTKQFLRTSREDLQASKMLYKGRMFAPSVYHLQQCVEKMTKAFVLGTRMGTPKEVRDIGHDSLKGHLLYARKLSRFIPKLGKVDPRLNFDLSRIDEIDAKKTEVARMSKSEIERIIKSFKAADKSMQAVVSLLAEWAPTGMIPLLQGAQGPVMCEKDVESIRKGIKKAIPLMRTVPFLFVASALTFPHEASTRYPDGPIGPQDYTRSMGIVACSPEIMRRVENTLHSLETLWM